MIEYPRKCLVCTYVANNPAMYHYHMKTHTTIPVGTLCYVGCGQLAQYRSTSGKCRCVKKIQNCPQYKQNASVRTTIMWNSGSCDDRKQVLVSRVLQETVEQRRERINKQVCTKQIKLIATEHSLTKRQYLRAVIYHSRKTYQMYMDEINPNGYNIARQQYHLDHKVSRHMDFY